MPAIDLNVRVQVQSELESFVDMAKSLGINGIVVPLGDKSPEGFEIDELRVFTRYDIHSQKVGAVKHQINKFRNRFTIIAVALTDVDTANWAASDAKVDLLTLLPTNSELRNTTARLAAKSGVALEVPISPLLGIDGLARSKILKNYSEAIRTASKAGMNIILSSGSSEPIQMRSPWALGHIGALLGIDMYSAKNAILEYSGSIITENLKKLGDNHVSNGIDIISRGERD
ncbi:MAG: RNase P subunit p30 family protein [Candidatus Thorarchaeota archaeon]